MNMFTRKLVLDISQFRIYMCFYFKYKCDKGLYEAVNKKWTHTLYLDFIWIYVRRENCVEIQGSFIKQKSDMCTYPTKDNMVGVWIDIRIHIFLVDIPIWDMNVSYLPCVPPNPGTCS